MYVTWSDVVQRFKTADDYVQNSADRASAINYAEADLHSLLGNSFTIPFSSNNLTAKDLTIDLVYANTVKYRDEERHAAILKRIKDVTASLCLGNTNMVLDDNTTLSTSGSISTGKIYSNTAGYTPVFDTGDILDQEVDSDLIDDLDDAKD